MAGRNAEMKGEKKLRVTVNQERTLKLISYKNLMNVYHNARLIL